MKDLAFHLFFFAGGTGRQAKGGKRKEKGEKIKEGDSIG